MKLAILVGMIALCGCTTATIQVSPSDRFWAERQHGSLGDGLMYCVANYDEKSKAARPVCYDTQFVDFTVRKWRIPNQPPGTLPQEGPPKEEIVQTNSASWIKKEKLTGDIPGLVKKCFPRKGSNNYQCGYFDPSSSDPE